MSIDRTQTAALAKAPKEDAGIPGAAVATLVPGLRKIAVASGQTLLAAALDAGIDYPHGCKAGRCGNCKSRLVSGEVDLLEHTRFALSDEEREAGLILACRALPKSDVTVAWLGDEETLPAHPLVRTGAEVVSVEEATHDIRILRLRPKRGPMMFSAGQYVTLALPGLPPRDYSMASRPGEGILEFHVRLVQKGRVSAAVRRLVPGDLLEIEGPRGSAHLRPGHTGPILAVAGGSGLAPVQAILASLVDLGMRQPVRVYLGVREERDIYGLEALQALARRHGDMQVTPVLSMGQPGSGHRTGFVHEAVRADLPALKGWCCYTAGPPAMIDALTETALAAGLLRSDLHADVFFTPEERSGHDGGKLAGGASA